ncbi:hypothetical protein [Streptomyces sp. AJS327]|uniref:hypothetical protein n=1 Tax=Streptomyces sp. AJS327 TaxID=2545265 RepID=UPI0015DDDDA3|nr:hypothetical protein [Streptomyces sp. AJS327]
MPPSPITETTEAQPTKPEPESESEGGFRIRDALPNRQLAAALCRGSGRLVRLGWQWITAEDWRLAAQRAGGVALGALVGAHLAQTYSAVVMPLVTGGWVVGALILAPQTKPATTADDDGDEGSDQTPTETGNPLPSPTPHADTPEASEAGVEAGPEVTRDQVIELIRRVADDQQGAHHADLLTSGELTGWDRDDLRAALADWGIPEGEFKIRDAAGRQRVRVGVRVRDLPTPVGEGPTGPAPTPPTALTKPPTPPPPPGGATGPAAASPPPEDDPHPRVGVAR